MPKAIYTRKPRRCPQCKSQKIARIQYGMPAYSDELQKAIDAGEIVLGGCCIGEYDPSWKCLDCGLEIYKKR